MLLSNIDINEYINKYLDINEILLLRQSYKKNNFKIYKYHNVIRQIKLYSNYNINKEDNYKIELIISNNIKYINMDTIDILKERGVKEIYKIQIEKKLSYNNLEEITLHMDILTNLLKILIKNYKIKNLEIYIYYIYLEKEILYNFDNILLNLNSLYSENEKDGIINNVYRFLSKQNYIVKEFNIDKYNMILNRL